MKGLKTLAVIAGVAAAAAMLTTGCSPEQREEIKAERDVAFVDRQWDDGVREAEKGFDQLDAFDRDLAEAEPDFALNHLKKSAEHFDKARTHFAKAEVGREKQGAIDDINAGYDALDKAIGDLEEGKVDSAQAHLDKAYEHFTRADQTLA